MTEKDRTFGKNWLHHLVIAINAMERHDYSSYLSTFFVITMFRVRIHDVF